MDLDYPNLRFVKCFSVDFFIESLGHAGTLENAVLAEEEPVLEGKFGEGEANYEALPWEQRPV